MNSDILDREDPIIAPADPQLRRRAVRFLIYALSILAVVWYRLYFSLSVISTGEHLASMEIETLYRRVIPISMAAIWLFSGLGLVAVVQAYRKQQFDIWWGLLGLAHGFLFLSYTAKSFFFFVNFTFFQGLE
ncbi:MAG: hypothetical protein D6772_12920 [Bacteroidetes bacterium]|nr:MAG: hypothetical protein D6772_12920 [Bacteroidota bacterium]